MKKTAMLLLIVVLCMSAGCFAEERTAVAPLIRLSGNPTTGFIWTCEISNPQVLAVEETYHQHDAPQGVLGVGGTQEFRLTGLQMGRAEVRFAYARSWKDEPPQYTLTYYVTVDEKLNAVITESVF